MAINKKFIRFKTLKNYLDNKDLILPKSIVFVSEANAIYLNGEEFSTNSLFNLEDLLSSKLGVDLTSTDTTNLAIVKLYNLIQLLTEAKELTREEVLNLIDTNALITGKSYLITDYKTVVSGDSIQSVDLGDNLLYVTALSSNTLDVNAKYIVDGNVYDCKYTIYNDINTYDWASENGYGVIYQLTDEYENTLPYDFFSIQFKSGDEYKYTFDCYGENYLYSGNVFNVTIKPYTVDKKQYLNNILFDIDDTSSTVSGIFIDYNCHDIVFKENTTNVSIGLNGYDFSFGKVLNNLKIGNDCYTVTLNNSCNDIEIDSNSYNINISTGCHHVYLNELCSNINLNGFNYDIHITKSNNVTIKNGSYSVTLSKDCNDSTISANKVTLGAECYGCNITGYDIVLEHGSDSVTIKSGGYITLGVDSFNTTIGSDCYYITLQNGCVGDTIGDGCSGVILENNVRSSKIGNNCSSITIGLNSNGVTIPDYSNQIILELNTINTTFTVSDETGYNHFENSKVRSGVLGKTVYPITYNTSEIPVEYGNNSEGDLVVYYPCDLTAAIPNDILTENNGCKLTSDEIREALKTASLGYTDEEIEEIIEDVPNLTLANIDYAKSILDSWDPSTTSFSTIFKNDTKLVILPKIDTSNLTSLGNGFFGCTNFRYIPFLDFSKVLNLTDYGPFYNCKLRRLPAFHFDKFTGWNKNSLFAKMPYLEIVKGRTDILVDGTAAPEGNTEEVLWLPYQSWLINWFSGCSRLKSIPKLASKGFYVSIASAFESTAISYLPITELPDSITDANQILAGGLSGDCSDITISGNKVTGLKKPIFTGITKSPKFNFPNLTSLSWMISWQGGGELSDLSNLTPTNVDHMFIGCTVEKVLGLNFEKVTTGDPASYYYGLVSSTPYVNIINLGKSSKTSYDFVDLYQWGCLNDENLQSLVDSLITNSYDRAANGMSACTLSLSKWSVEALTAALRQAIKDKGFTIIAYDLDRNAVDTYTKTNSKSTYRSRTRQADTNITADDGYVFTQAEEPSEGDSRVYAKYISLACNDSIDNWKLIPESEVPDKPTLTNEELQELKNKILNDSINNKPNE